MPDTSVRHSFHGLNGAVAARHNIAALTVVAMHRKHDRNEALDDFEIGTHPGGGLAMHRFRPPHTHKSSG